MEYFALPEDQATLKAVERRKSAEAARKARIYDTRFRVMGVDVAALNKQVEEKQRQRNVETLRDKAHGETRLAQLSCYTSMQCDEIYPEDFKTSKQSRWFCSGFLCRSNEAASRRCGSAAGCQRDK